MKTIWGKAVCETLGELVDPSRAALVLIDIQNDFCHPDGCYGQIGKDLSQIQELLPRVVTLLEGARRAGVPVIWVQQTLLPNALADSPSWLRRRTRSAMALEWTLEGTWGADFIEPLRPRPGEPRVEKHRSSAFVGTCLDLLLRSNEMQSLVVAGVVTQGCVESTVRDATFYDYYVVLVQDCVGTIDRELHAASMRCQSTRCDFADSEAILAQWAAAPARAPLSVRAV